jgi:glutamyl-tRNA synthetase
VVDDIEMSITHVIRGQDHLTNTHKQVLLYEALGKPVPQFAHLPLIMAPGREKLSKRKHGRSGIGYDLFETAASCPMRW